jgi:hypothetical protein
LADVLAVFVTVVVGDAVVLDELAARDLDVVPRHPKDVAQRP